MKPHTDAIQVDDGVMISMSIPDEALDVIEERFDEVEVIDSWQQKGDEKVYVGTHDDDDWTLCHQVDIVL